MDITKRILLFSSTLLLLASFGCGSSIKVGRVNPPWFYLSGRRPVDFFEIWSFGDEHIWRIHPAKKGVTFSELGTIRYGKLPANWIQEFPQNSEPPHPLVEGKIYHAIALFSDGAETVKIEFDIVDDVVKERAPGT